MSAQCDEQRRLRAPWRGHQLLHGWLALAESTREPRREDEAAFEV